MKKFSRLFLVALTFGMLLPNVGKAESLRGRYFVVVFGYQGQGNRATDSHTFATFISGDELSMGKTSEFPTISWLPATGVVRPVRREPGRNFSLSQTLMIARRNVYQVQAYGPYEISYDLYQRAGWQIERLNSGATWYKMINGPLSGGALNCINAVGDIAGDIRTGTNWGFAASRDVVIHFASFMRNYPSQNEEVARLIRLKQLVRGF